MGACRLHRRSQQLGADWEQQVASKRFAASVTGNNGSVSANGKQAP
jgi:hypothetical protein